MPGTHTNTFLSQASLLETAVNDWVYCNLPRKRCSRATPFDEAGIAVQNRTTRRMKNSQVSSHYMLNFKWA